MSSRNQALYAGLAVAAAALVAGYLVLYKNQDLADKSLPKSSSKPSDDEKAGSKSPVRTTRDATETTTPLVSNTSNRGSDDSVVQTDKEIHSKIEELDKIGKKLFKEKKVRK